MIEHADSSRARFNDTHERDPKYIGDILIFYSLFLGNLLIKFDRNQKKERMNFIVFDLLIFELRMVRMDRKYNLN